MDKLEEAIKDLSLEQQQKIRDIHEHFTRRAAHEGARLGILFAVMNLIVLLLNALVVHSKPFLMLTFAVNWIFLFRGISSSMRGIKSDASEAVRSVLENK